MISGGTPLRAALPQVFGLGKHRDPAISSGIRCNVPTLIAARLGISIATARSQLKGVMAKTGTGRQTELALLLSGLTGQGQEGDVIAL